jgi:hypothetical protein
MVLCLEHEEFTEKQEHFLHVKKKRSVTCKSFLKHYYSACFITLLTMMQTK